MGTTRVLALAGCVLLAADAPAAAQNTALAEISIEVSNHKTTLPVTVAGTTLRMILDSGMGYDGVLVFDSAKVDLARFGHLARARIGGAGSGQASHALVDPTAGFSVGPLQLDSQQVIILTSGSFRGFPRDGVIGYSLLGHYAVEIDYDRNLMRLYPPDGFRPKPGWRSVDLSFKDTGTRIPWMRIGVDTGTGKLVELEAYIDFAAGEMNLLQRDRMRFTLPPTTGRRVIGRGLSGDVYGSDARIPEVRIGPFQLRDVAALVVPAASRSRQRGAEAIVGNDALRRFNLVFDYAHRKLWLRPNRSFGEPF